MPVVSLALSIVVVVKSRSQPHAGGPWHLAIAHAMGWIGIVALLTYAHSWLMYALMTSAQGRAPVSPFGLIFG
jgi:hypothetical protein